MKIIIAPNAFKNSLSAIDAAKALQEGIGKSGLHWKTVLCPVGDGGDGTGAILRQYFDATFFSCSVRDPLGRPVEAGFGLTKDKTAIIELADASGLRLLLPGEYNPLLANTRGTGTVIKTALDAGAKKIFLCVGGSATIDGGCGILCELGAAFIDESGTEIVDLPLGLIELKHIDITNLDKRLAKTEMVILCDVKNQLLGKNGAAFTFGPQKGANKNDIKFLEKCLTRLEEVLITHSERNIRNMVHGGAAGGVAASLTALCKAQAVDGIDYFLQIVEFKKIVKDANLVITGEGRLDEQTLHGKAPYGVAIEAKKNNIPVIAVAGKIAVGRKKKLTQHFDEMICINDEPRTTQKNALKNTYINLVKTGEKIAAKFMARK